MIAGNGFKDEMGSDLKEIHSICKDCLHRCKKLQLKKYVWCPSECPSFVEGVIKNHG